MKTKSRTLEENGNFLNKDNKLNSSFMLAKPKIKINLEDSYAVVHETKDAPVDDSGEL